MGLGLKFGGRALILWAALCAGGCAPVLSNAVLESSDPTLSFEDLRRNPDAHAGKTLVLGGTIIDVFPGPEGVWLEVLQRPLGFRMEPEIDDRTGGRFLVEMGKNLDERQFVKRRKITLATCRRGGWPVPDCPRKRPFAIRVKPAESSVTLAAEVIGKETRPLDQTQYVYPLLRAKEYHVWSDDVFTRPMFHFGFGISQEF
ncbi:MAG: Slp family lipoprotein [Nitrospinae bacterium]|nr:Slp family lipoprotein [Nitrospinota bacterium]